MNKITVITAVNVIDIAYKSYLEHLKSIESPSINFILKYNKKNIPDALIYSSKYTKYLNTYDLSIYDAWEQALDLGINDYVAFVGCDDFINPLFLHEVLKVKDSPDIIYGDSEVQSNNFYKYIKHNEKTFKSFYGVRPEFHVSHPGMMFHKHLFNSKPSFDISFKLAGDYDFILRKLMNIREHKYIPISQGLIGKKGVSNRIESVLNYKNEYKIIERRYNVKIKSSMVFNIKYNLLVFYRFFLNKVIEKKHF